MASGEWDDLFEDLGAADPADWIADGDDEVEARAALHRFLFLRQAVRLLADARDTRWIDNQVAATTRKPDAPLAGAGLAIAALRSKGATDAELATLVRTMQAEMLHGLLYLLGDPDLADDEDLVEAAGLGPVGWHLVICDDDGEPGDVVLANLHESLLAADPDGREFRP